MPRKIMALVLTTIFVSTASFAEMIEKKDRFTGATTFSTPYVPRGERIPQFVFIVTSTKEHPKNMTSTLFIMYYAASWKYLECHGTYFLADGEPVELPDSTVKGDVGNGGVLERIVITQIPFGQLQRLARARKIEYKICNDEYQMIPTEQQDLREAVSYIEKAQQ